MTDDDLSVMRKRLDMAIEAYSESRDSELDDLKFYAGSPDNQWQWPADVLQTRGAVQGQTINARPCLTINKLPQHVKQVTNDQRQNRPAGKVIPANDQADIEMAEIFDGMVRHIEYISDADVCVDTACDNQVSFGEGYWRLLTEYCEDDGFNQDIRYGRIRNSFSVYMDPTIQDPCGADAEWCIIMSDWLHEDYERKWPKAKPISSLQAGIGDQQMSQWVNEKTIRIAEYFHVEHKTKTLNLYHGGITAMSGSPEAKAAEGMGLISIKTRPVDQRQVKWCKTNGYETLEETDWPGKWIPVIRVVGNEFEIEGRLYLSGLVRNAKDAQRMYNYWTPLALDTPIPTPQGWTTMGAVRAGDMLFDENGKPCKVLGKSPVHIGRDCYKITFDDGCEIVADGQHQWRVEERGKRQEKSFEWVGKTLSTAELCVGQHFINVPGAIQGQEPVLLDPYFLGVWLGDGDTINPQITQGDEDIDAMRGALSDRGLHVGEKRKSSTAWRFTVHGVRSKLVEIGVLGKKHIPKNYLRASHEDRLDLLQGLMDTDGSVSKTGQCSFTTVLPQLRADLEELLHSLGVKFSVCERAGVMRKFPSGNEYECADSWQFSFSLRDDMAFFKLPRKAAVCKSRYHARRTKRFGIKVIERVPSVPTQCVCVDTEAHLFLAGTSMIPTHNSQEAEMLALAPKAPFIGYGGQFEGYEHQWKTANTTNWPYLEVNPEVQDGQGSPLSLPERAAPPLPQAGLIQAKMGASDDIKTTTGQYDPSLGAESNEKSGKAILARERQTDTGTYHYVDNLSRAVRHCTRQIVDLIPKIYDTRRIARIIGLDGETDHVEIDPTQQEPVRTIKDEQTGATLKKIYNPGIGKYDVCVTTGPSYMTKRQEALEAMAQLLQGNPQLWSVAGDLFIKNMDWPGAEEMAERFKKTIDPKLLDDSQDDPALVAAQQQMQAMGQELDQLHKMLQNVNSSMEARKLDNEHFKADILAYQAETQRLAALAGAGTPEEIRATVQQVVQEILASPPLEQEETGGLENNEQHNMPQGEMTGA